MQAMSGDTTCYWDPSGAALAQTVVELRSPAPRGRSVRHTQPELAARFADQWSVWGACRSAPGPWAGAAPQAAAAIAYGSSGAELPYVGDALCLRLPLRLQDHHVLQGSAMASGLGAGLGVSSRSLGLSLEGVRRQVGVWCMLRH